LRRFAYRDKKLSGDCLCPFFVRRFIKAQNINVMQVLEYVRRGFVPLPVRLSQTIFDLKPVANPTPLGDVNPPLWCRCRDKNMI
jgi:hypothetical protein